MDIVINELSLTGQFSDIDHFSQRVLVIIKVLKVLQNIDECSLLKKYELYNYPITRQHNFSEVLTGKKNDAITRFKSILASLLNTPFWEDNPKHDLNSEYICEFTDKTSRYSLAEAYARDNVTISFPDSPCDNSPIIVANKQQQKRITNITCCDQDFWSLVYSLIEPLEYCKEKYQGTNLSFSNIDPRYSFNTLDDNQCEAFISAFNRFSQMPWPDILADAGLQYKKYTPSNDKSSWFRGSEYQGKNICKFRVSRLMRCFGYREGDIFHVLRFEIDHRISDHG